MMEKPYKNPKSSGFVWDIVESSFSHSIDDNPLFTTRIHDSDSIMQEQLRLYEDEIAAFAEDPNTPLAGNGPPVHIGIDCEYQYDPKTQSNQILSYQFVLYSAKGVLKGIVYPGGKHAH